MTPLLVSDKPMELGSGSEPNWQVGVVGRLETAAFAGVATAGAGVTATAGVTLDWTIWVAVGALGFDLG